MLLISVHYRSLVCVSTPVTDAVLKGDSGVVQRDFGGLYGDSCCVRGYSGGVQ